jgi:hypothetical protein
LEEGFGQEIYTHGDLRKDMDGDQDPKMYLRPIKAVAQELFGDPRFKDKMYLTFQPTFNEANERTFGSAMDGVWAQINACEIGTDKVLLVMALFIDASHAKNNLSIKPIYCKFLSGLFSLTSEMWTHHDSWLLFCSDFIEHSRKRAVQIGRGAFLWDLACL